jgi:hypothetical protein
MSTFDSLYAPPKAFDQFGNFIPMDAKLLDWLTTNRTDAQNYLRLNKGFQNAEVCKAILQGSNDVAIARKSGLSTVNIKKLRRQGREQVANHTTIQPRWGFRANDPSNPQMAKQASILTSRLNAWFFDQFVDKSIEAALINTEGSGTGYVFLWPEKSVLTGKIDIIPYPLDYKDVLAFHYPKDSNYQNSYGLEIRLEMSVPEAHERFPNHTNIINKDRNVPSTIARAFKKVTRPFKGVVDRMAHNKSKTKNISSFPTVDIFFTWVRDAAINTTGKTIQMGAANTVYSYSVPSYTDFFGKVNQVGTGIFIDEKDDITLETKSVEQMRDLTPDECKLYPNRRLIISCSGGILYDGAPLWGGNLVPIVPFRFEEVNGELLGIPPLNDGREIENAANSLVRSIIDSTIARKAPPVAIDSNAPKEMRGDNFSINKPNQKFVYDLRMLQTPLKVLVPSDHYQIDPASAELVKMLFGMQDYLVGTSDWQQAAAQLKQMPAQDTQESLVRALGVLATSQSRSIEKSLLMMGLIWVQFFPQVYDTRELLNVLGPNGVDWQQFDYDPNSLVPKVKTIIGHFIFAVKNI